MSLREAAQQALEALEIAPLDHNSIKSRFFEHRHHAIIALRDALGADTRTCTCHPGDSPPNPCQRKYALSECLDAALAEDAMQRLTDVQQEMEATSQESRQVEPVAYVTGYSKGRCTIKAVDPDWLLPVGMALYRSPSTINEMETVEPVAWAVITRSGKLYKAASIKESAERKAQQQIDKLGAEWKCSVVPLYTAPPKRKPLTQESLENLFLGNNSNDWWRLELKEFVNVARAIERAHDIGE
jgi:hypothetical protein